MLLVFLAFTAQAASHAAPMVDPGLEPSDVQAQFRDWAKAQGRPEAGQELVCRDFAEKVELCFTRRDATGRVYLTQADGKDVAALEAAARGTAAEAVAHLDPVAVAGFSQRYWVSAQGDGRDHAALLFPDAVRTRLGGDFVVAAPARGVLIAWVPGDLEFDKAVAVGVRHMYDTLPDPVSPLVYKWDGKKWLTWGDAHATPATGPIEPVPPAPVPAAPTPPER